MQTVEEKPKVHNNLEDLTETGREFQVLWPTTVLILDQYQFARGLGESNSMHFRRKSWENSFKSQTNISQNYKVIL